MIKNETGFPNELIDALASLEHERWARWYEWQRDHSTPENLSRWGRQARRKFFELSEEDKDKDRREVMEYLPLISDHLAKEPQDSREGK